MSISLPTIPPGLSSLADYEGVARARLPAQAWEYFMGVAADGVTARENQAAYARLKLRGRVLADFEGGGHTRIRLFGRELDHPILLAPVAAQKLAHPEGEVAVAVGAAASGALYVASTQAGTSLEDIARAAPGAPRWFQLYWQADRGLVAELARRAEAAGYEALVLTVDAPVTGPRDGGRGVFSPSAGVIGANFGGRREAGEAGAAAAMAAGEGLCGGLLAAAPRWADLAWLRSVTRLPVILKGIMDAEDAARALAEGMGGIVVSNHGGRTLDTLPATIEVLPEIVAAVGGRMPVLVDGGVRRGTDVLKALAIGASAVLIGRPYVHGLAVAGAPGVAHVVRLLRAELEIAMALTGCPVLGQLGREVLRSERGAVG
jgi:4-hydroxymandelate oxidase